MQLIKIFHHETSQNLIYRFFLYDDITNNNFIKSPIENIYIEIEIDIIISREICK